MTATPSVSICVPTYNGERYLRECLESIGSQTFQDYEVLIVDDGSTDDTLDICMSYARGDPRVRVERNTHNLGLVGNWNRCVDLARGEWIKFVFQDDLIDRTCLEELLLEGKDSGCALVFCRRRYLFEVGTPEELQDFYESHLRLAEEHFPAPGAVTADAFVHMLLSSAAPDTNFIGEPISVLFRKSVVKKFGGFNPLLAVSCDSEFWQRVGVNIGIAHVPTELATFRVHADATTSRHLRERNFRMNVLDPVVVLHEHAFHPDFGPMRRTAMNEGKNLEERFREMADWAFANARYLASPLGGGDGKPLAEWHRLGEALPRIAQIESAATAKQGFSGRITAKLRRLLAGT